MACIACVAVVLAVFLIVMPILESLKRFGLSLRIDAYPRFNRSI